MSSEEQRFARVGFGSTRDMLLDRVRRIQAQSAQQ